MKRVSCNVKIFSARGNKLRVKIKTGEINKLSDRPNSCETKIKKILGINTMQVLVGAAPRKRVLLL